MKPSSPIQPALDEAARYFETKLASGPAEFASTVIYATRLATITLLYLHLSTGVDAEELLNETCSHIKQDFTSMLADAGSLASVPCGTEKKQGKPEKEPPP